MVVYSTRLLGADVCGIASRNSCSVVDNKEGSIFRIGVTREGVVGFDFRRED